MAYLTVAEQVEAITTTGITLLGLPRADVEAMIAKRDGDRLALNRLRVQLNTRHRSACAQINRAAADKELDEYAQRAREGDVTRKETEATERRARRKQLPLSRRLDDALAALSTMSTIRAAALADPALKDVKAPKIAESHEPTGGEALDISPLLTGMVYLIERLEAVGDAERGLLPMSDLAQLGLVLPQNLRMMSGAAKDDMILLHLRGVHADMVAEAMPWLGSSRSIRRLRAEHGQRIDGTDKKAA